MRRRGLAILVVWAACLAGTVAVAPARADETAADSLLRIYLQSMADSSDLHFGAVAAPTDTAGLDSARVFALAHPERWGYRRNRRFGYYPVLNFNRVDGPVMGAGVSYGLATKWGRLSGDWATATGPNISLGGGRYLKVHTRGESEWRLEVWAGRRTAVMDPENEGHALGAMGAFITGDDRAHFLQRDGVKAQLLREGQVHRLGVTYRDQLESPRVTTATWNLLNNRPDVVFNLPASPGHAHELEGELLWKVPVSPLITQLVYTTSSRSIGSDFEYRRTRVSAGADIGLWRTFALLPQVEYGALTGDLLPQQAFYFGGPRTMRSLPYAVAGGSRLALGKLDLIFVHDVFKDIHLPSPWAFPVQLGAFAAAGAVWGTDPYTGRVRPGVDWPNQSDWREEAGVSVMYQPGIPDPTMFVRFNWAWPLGPDSTPMRFSVTVQRGLDLLNPFHSN